MLRLLLLCGLVATSILLVDSADQQPEEQLMTDLLGIGNATSRKLRSFNSSYPNQQYAVMGPRNQMAKGMPTPLPSVTVPTVPPPKNEEEFKKVIGYSDPKPQPEQSLKVFGKIGKNYFMERGKPFIYCAFSQRERPIDYNLEENDLQNITFDESIEMKKCNLDWGRNHDRLSCFTVFTYKGTDEQLKNDPDPRRHFAIQNQDCWTNQHEAIEHGCHKGPRCVFHGALQANGQHFCCCNEHNCNELIDWDPSLETRPEFMEAARDQVAKKLLLKEATKTEEQRRRQDEDRHHNQLIRIIVVFMALIASICLCCASCVICKKTKVYKWRPMKKQAVAAAEETQLVPENQPENAASDEEKREEQRPKTWEILRNTLQEVGQGKYGMVYKAEWLQFPDSAPKTVAVKVFKGNSTSFQNELNIYNEPCMQKCMKNSILRLLEYDKDELTLITEYHEMGNLNTFLKHKTIDVPIDALTLCMSLVEALTFLHEERGGLTGDPKPVILHRDVKSHNVLLKCDSRGRLIGVLMDFGLSLKVNQWLTDHEKHQMRKIVGTQRYMAPELLHGSTEISVENFKTIDVYAMGLVLWEILSRSKVSSDEEVPPYEEPLERQLRVYQAKGPIRLPIYRICVVDKKARPEFRESLHKDPLFSKVMWSIEEMWEHESASRVKAACVRGRIEMLIDEGYQSGTLEASNSVRSSDTEDLTPPTSRQPTPVDKVLIVQQEDETKEDGIHQEEDPSVNLLPSKQKGTRKKSKDEEIEMQDLK